MQIVNTVFSMAKVLIQVLSLSQEEIEAMVLLPALVKIAKALQSLYIEKT